MKYYIETKDSFLSTTNSEEESSWYFINIILCFICFYFCYYAFNNINYINYCNCYANINDEYIHPIIYNNIITDYEANYILKQMIKENYSEDITIIDGKKVNIGNSKTLILSKNDKIIKNIILKASNITGYPLENIEDLEIIKYDPNGTYKLHYDSSCRHDTTNSTQSFQGHRCMTITIFLNDTFEGGSINFVNLNKYFKPSKYGGLVFHTLDKTKKKIHPKSLHVNTSVLSGSKYVAIIWIRDSIWIRDTI